MVDTYLHLAQDVAMGLWVVYLLWRVYRLKGQQAKQAQDTARLRAWVRNQTAETWRQTND